MVGGRERVGRELGIGWRLEMRCLWRRRWMRRSRDRGTAYLKDDIYFVKYINTEFIGKGF